MAAAFPENSEPELSSLRFELGAVPVTGNEWFDPSLGVAFSSDALNFTDSGSLAAPTNNQEFAVLGWESLWRQPTVIPMAIVPEPGAGALLLLGLSALAVRSRRRN